MRWHWWRMRIGLEVARRRVGAHGRERILSWALRRERIAGARGIAESVLLRHVHQRLRRVRVGVLWCGCYDAWRVATMAGRRAYMPVP
jgi:hypothetical protein